jgi:hypothetical protein
MRVAHFELELEFLYLEAHAPGVAKLDTFFVRRPLTTGESVASNRPMLSIGIFIKRSETATFTAVLCDTLD